MSLVAKDRAWGRLYGERSCTYVYVHDYMSFSGDFKGISEHLAGYLGAWLGGRNPVWWYSFRPLRRLAFSGVCRLPRADALVFTHKSVPQGQYENSRAVHCCAKVALQLEE